MERPKERGYVTMNCGNCYRSAAEAPEARFYTCTRCGAPTYECTTCARLGKERALPGVATCATCSLQDEVRADAS
jgi:ribosomal protein L37AE/L43A